MGKPSKKFFTFLVIVFCVGIISIAKFFVTPSVASSSKMNSLKVKGERNAPIQITEFIDFQCPACAQGAKFLKKFMQDHPSLVRLELKYYPLSMHHHSFVSARYVQCAGRQGKLWAYEDELIEKQHQWEMLFDAKPAFDFIAQDVHLDISKLNTCLQDPQVDAQIEADKQEGQSRGVRSTPTYFINTKMVVGSVQLETEVNKLLNGLKK